MDEDAIREAFFTCKTDVDKMEGGEYDEHGFYRLPDGDFYDPDGYYFNKDGQDQFGGYYDDDFMYHPAEKYLNLGKNHHI
jgi:esterase/lipase superfamily enzyme